MGTEITREFTAYLAGAPEGFAINTVRLEAAKGIGISSGQGSDPIVRLRTSTDGGNTWTNWRDRKLGAQGVQLLLVDVRLAETPRALLVHLCARRHAVRADHEQLLGFG
jgi:hypothetical protein